MVDVVGANVSDIVTMTRLEGKIDVLNERQKNMGENWSQASNRLNTHSRRIGVLEQKDTLDQGKEQGVAAVVKVLWAILAVMLTGGLVTIGAIVAYIAGAFK